MECLDYGGRFSVYTLEAKQPEFSGTRGQFFGQLYFVLYPCDGLFAYCVYCAYIFIRLAAVYSYVFPDPVLVSRLSPLFQGSWRDSKD